MFAWQPFSVIVRAEFIGNYLYLEQWVNIHFDLRPKSICEVSPGVVELTYEVGEEFNGSDLDRLWATRLVEPIFG